MLGGYIKPPPVLREAAKTIQTSRVLPKQQILKIFVHYYDQSDSQAIWTFLSFGSKLQPPWPILVISRVLLPAFIAFWASPFLLVSPVLGLDYSFFLQALTAFLAYHLLAFTGLVDWLLWCSIHSRFHLYFHQGRLALFHSDAQSSFNPYLRWLAILLAITCVWTAYYRPDSTRHLLAFSIYGVSFVLGIAVRGLPLAVTGIVFWETLGPAITTLTAELHVRSYSKSWSFGVILLYALSMLAFDCAFTHLMAKAWRREKIINNAWDRYTSLALATVETATAIETVSRTGWSVLKTSLIDLLCGFLIAYSTPQHNS